MHVDQPDACTVSAETETIYTIVAPRLNIASINRLATPKGRNSKFLAIMYPRNVVQIVHLRALVAGICWPPQFTVGICKRRRLSIQKSRSGALHRVSPLAQKPPFHILVTAMIRPAPIPQFRLLQTHDFGSPT